MRVQASAQLHARDIIGHCDFEFHCCCLSGSGRRHERGKLLTLYDSSMSARDFTKNVRANTESGSRKTISRVPGSIPSSRRARPTSMARAYLPRKRSSRVSACSDWADFSALGSPPFWPFPPKFTRRANFVLKSALPVHAAGRLASLDMDQAANMENRLN